MATVKIKLRPSSVEGKAGVIFYQITHNRKTQHITTRLRVQPFDWNADKEKLEPSAPTSWSWRALFPLRGPSMSGSYITTHTG